jgi:hypothetical protein
MRTALVLSLALLIAACSSGTPVPIRAGDVCFTCRRPITNTKLAAEVIDQNGMALKFRTVTCMAKFMTTQTREMRGLFVTDYQSGRFVPARSAMFVYHKIDETTNEMDYAAFSTVPQAVEFGKKKAASPVDWLQIMQFTKAKGSN